MTIAVDWDVNQLNKQNFCSSAVACAIFVPIFSVFYEASRCAMRDLISVTAPSCQLSDIEPTVRAGFFIEYAQLSNCPCKLILR